MSHENIKLLNREMGAAYAEFRQAFICAAAHEEQLKADLKVFEASSGDSSNRFLGTYVQVALASTVTALDNLVKQTDIFKGLIPQAVLDDVEVLRQDVTNAASDSARELEVALREVASAGSAGAWLARVRREAAARRDVFRLGAPLVDNGRTNLSDLLRLRNAVLAESRTPLIHDLTADTAPPEPQPLLILCAFGPPGARLVCIIGLAIAIGASNHNVE